MKLAHCGERFKDFGIETSYLVAALVASCFVAGLSPNPVKTVVPYNATISNGEEYYCARFTALQDFSNIFGN